MQLMAKPESSAPVTMAATTKDSTPETPTSGILTLPVEVVIKILDKVSYEFPYSNPLTT